MRVLCLGLIFVGVVCMWLRGIGMTFHHAHLGWFGAGCVIAGVWMVPVADAVF